LTEYRKFNDFKAEIQVRSILQHAWAEIEHDLGYKTKNAIPLQIRRRFSRLAGLLELADDEFVHIRNELSDYTNNVAEMISSDPSKVKIDRISLCIYIENSKLVKKVNKQIEKANHVIFEKAEPIFLDFVLDRLRYLGFKTIADIDDALILHQKKVVSIAGKLTEPAGLGEGTYMADSGLFYLCYAVLSNKKSQPLVESFCKKFIDKKYDKETKEFANFILGC
jgi:hypothetical protein